MSDLERRWLNLIAAGHVAAHVWSHLSPPVAVALTAADEIIVEWRPMNGMAFGYCVRMTVLSNTEPLHLARLIVSDLLRRRDDAIAARARQRGTIQYSGSP